MRKLILFLIVVVLVAGAGALIHKTRAQEPAGLTIQVNGETVVLKPGKNVTPEEFALAQDPALVAQSEWVQVDGYWALIAKGVTTPLEARQILLPDGHPEFPLDTVWIIVEDNEGPIEVPAPLRIPAGWQGKYQVRVDGNAAYYEYSVNPALKENLFAITAFTKAQWQALQGEPRGEGVFTYGGVVWVYNPALENPYAGAQADEFSQMVGEASVVVEGLGWFFSPDAQAEAARRSLLTYLAALSEGRYDEAAYIYAGDYEILSGYNPEIAPTGHAALFEAACKINGFACQLQFRSIVRQVALSDTTFRFTVEFQNPDGSLFELGPCLETGYSECLLRTQFDYSVQWQDGHFRVLELPIYVP